MKRSTHILLFVCSLALFCTIGCQNKQPTPNPKLANIDFLRGDILLCGGDQFGEVSFSLSCNYATRETFDLAVSLLHSFEYAEAEKAFVKVIDSDPECAMAYWGAAMSIYHSLWKAPEPAELEKGVKILQIAKTLPTTIREREYLDAIGAYYTDWKDVDARTRAMRMENKMEEIYEKYEDDTEAAIFYALALNSTADPEDKNYTNQRKAGRILESLFPDQPNHPGIAHYIIHNYDNPDLAHLALSTARKYANIAPSSAHAQHMPSHIFTRLGLWDESIQSNLKSASSARCYAEESEMDGNWTSELHAIDYLIYAYLQTGDNVKAGEQAAYFHSLKKVSGNNASIAYPLASIPARMVLENKQWVKAAQISFPSVELSWEHFPWEKSIIHFARVLGAAHTGDILVAEKELNTLQTLQQELVKKEDAYKANQVMIQIKASQAWIDFAKGNHEEALKSMQAAAEMEDNTQKHPVTPGEVLPARELLGDLLLAMDKPKAALEAYEINLAGHPNRFNGIYGAAMAANKAGKKEKARLYFENLLQLVESSESDRAEIKEAKNYLQKQSGA